MRTVLIITALAAIPWLANKLGASPLGTAIAALPLLVYVIHLNWSEDDPEESMLGNASEPIRRWLPLLLGAGAAAFGIGAVMLKGSSSLLSIFGWVLPFALIALVAGIINLLKK